MTTQETLPFGYSDEALIEFKNNIIPKLEKAHKELEYLKSFVASPDNEKRVFLPDKKEDDTGFEKKEMDQMIVRQQTFIDNLNAALQRIENKSYGICRITGKLIDKARLLAVPHATLSLEAKLGANKNAPDVPVIEVPKKEKKKAASKKQDEGKRYSDDDLRNFKTLISNKIDSANEELKYFRIVKEDRTKGIRVEGYENLSSEEAQALIDRQNSFISELENALDRVKKKTYGICQETGELIPKEILLQHPVIKRIKPTPERPSATSENKTEDIKVRACRICGCTDNDCRQCIEKTGKPCRWIDTDLCSACEEEAMKEGEQPEPLAISQQPLAKETITPSNNDNDMNFFQQLAQAAAQNVDITMRIMQKDNKLTVNIMPGSKSVTLKPILVTGTASELDDAFFKTIAPSISEINGIVHNMEDVKKELESKKAADIKKQIDAKKAQDKKKEVKSGSHKPVAKKPEKKKTPVKAEKEEIKPEVNNEPAEPEKIEPAINPEETNTTETGA